MRKLSLLLFLLILFLLISYVLGFTYDIKERHESPNQSGATLKAIHPSPNPYPQRSAQGQALIISNGSFVLARIQFYLFKTNNPAGNMTARVYGVTGVVGTNAKPNATLFAESDKVAMSSLGTGLANVRWINFVFNQTYTMVNGSDYAVCLIMLEGTVDVLNYVSMRTCAASGHPGNRFGFQSSAWANLAQFDDLFRLEEALDVDMPTVDYLGFNSTLNGSVARWTYNFSDDEGLSHFIHSWNNSGNWINSTYALTGIQNQTLLTWTLNATEGLRVEYQVFVNDTSNNWGETTLLFFHTNTEPVIIAGLSPAQKFIGALLLSGLGACLFLVFRRTKK